MPIGERPLLEYWLEILYSTKVRDVLVNLHHFAEVIESFLHRPRFADWVQPAYEAELLGTAGTLRANKDFFRGCTILLVHADNWCQCNFSDFLYYHQRRPSGCVMTMMTFESTTPETCGIVEVDPKGVVSAFHEKSKQPPGNCANAAVYLLEPEVLDWIKLNPEISDFSTEVLPHFMGRIATWKNQGIHRDVGALPMLRLAQSDPQPPALWPQTDSWQRDFLSQPIHQEIARIAT